MESAESVPWLLKGSQRDAWGNSTGIGSGECSKCCIIDSLWSSNRSHMFSSGSTVSLTVCARNTGNQAFYLESNLQSVSFSGLPSGVSGSFSLTSQQLAPGATSTITVTLTNDGNATSGSFAFTVTFRGYSTSSG